MMNRRVFVIGYPAEVGGANTELWHTVKLWRRFGVGVTLVPTWQAPPAWRTRLETIGCATVESSPNDLQDVPGLAGGIVVSFCNTKFLAVADRLRALECRIVWLGCMNWLFAAERLHYRRHGCFWRHVFQSRYQRDQLMPQLRRFGLEDRRTRVIHGPLCLDEFPFEPLPHAAGEAFQIGRISRGEVDKFARNSWQLYARTPHPLRVRVLGWSREVESRLGPPPPWATCLAPGAQPVEQFLKSLHVMVQVNGDAVENWPRVGLEAMAAGVPLVVESKGGWTEMVRHGETGFLCHSDDQIAYATARLAYDEPYRLAIARQARCDLVDRLARPEAIWAEWRELFEELDLRV
ncbi:MAG: glycosyltransferase family 4 protein [Thermoguttaceae bacterium]|jgi:hypothetical protein